MVKLFAGGQRSQVLMIGPKWNPPKLAAIWTARKDSTCTCLLFKTIQSIHVAQPTASAVLATRTSPMSG